MAEWYLTMKKIIKCVAVAIIFTEAFFVGVGIGVVKDRIVSKESVSVANSGNWGLGFGAEGTKPTGTESADTLKEYDAYYMAQSDEKILKQCEKSTVESLYLEWIWKRNNCFLMCLVMAELL